MSENSASGGVSILGLLGVLFVGLKLTGYVDWEWIWVLAPFWVIPAILLGIFLLFLNITIVLGFAIQGLEWLGKVQEVLKEK